MPQPIRRVLVELRPETRWLFEGGVQYRVRIQVDAGDIVYAHDKVINPDDFTSRFDWLFDHAKAIIKEMIERDGAPNAKENRYVQIKEACHATPIHEED